MLKVIQINACDSTASTGTVMRALACELACVEQVGIEPNAPRW